MKLPQGWFADSDIKFYREHYSNLKKGAYALEIGCWKGRSICSVADIIKSRNITVVAVDTFKGTSVHMDGLHKEALTTDIRQVFEKNLNDFKILNSVIVFQSKSEDALKVLSKQFDFAFIDGDHSPDSVKWDIRFTFPIMNDNSILAGHDAMFSGVIDSVNEVLGNVVVQDNIWYVRVR